MDANAFGNRSVACRRLDPADRDGVLCLLQNAPFKAAIWDWQFANNAGPDRGVVALRGREIVGFNGVMPVRVWDGAAAVAGLWSCDFVVRSDQRRGGVGRQLKQELERPERLLMTLGVSEAAGRLLRGRHWIEYSGPQPFELTRDPPPASALSRPARPPYAAIESTVLPEASVLEELLRRFRRGGAAAVDRDRAYLAWRYEAQPLAAYRFLSLSKDGAPCALLVLRAEPGVLHWVDYLGPLDDRDVLEHAVRVAGVALPTVRTLRCRTTWPALQNALRAAGWKPRGRAPRFFVKPLRRGVQPQPWFLMAGDSDGDLLQAARAELPDFTTRLWTEDELLAGEAEWQTLLAESNADPVFASWDWIVSWWGHLGKPRGMQLRMLAAYDAAGRLAGLMPLTLHVSRGGIAAARRLQLLGSDGYGAAGLRAGICELVLRRDVEQPVAYALARALLRDPGWHDLVIGQLPISSASFIALSSRLLSACLARPAAGAPATASQVPVIDTTVSFEAYLSGLDADARAALCDARQRLPAYALATCSAPGERLAGGAAVVDVLERLAGPTHAANANFRREIMDRLASGGRLEVDLLSIDGVPVSALCHARADGRQRLIETAVDAAAAARYGVSLDTVLIGHCAERACADPHISRYELHGALPGSAPLELGIADYAVSLARIQYVRPPVRRVLYRVRDALAERFGRTVNDHLVPNGAERLP